MLTRLSFTSPRSTYMDNGRVGVDAVKDDVSQLREDVNELKKQLSDFFSRLNAPGALNITQTAASLTSLDVSGNSGFGGTPHAYSKVGVHLATDKNINYTYVNSVNQIVGINDAFNAYVALYIDSSPLILNGWSGGSVVFNGAAIATNATDGFIYIPSCAGTPTGVPTAYTGRVPIVYDTSNNKLYGYNGSWKSVTLA